MTTAKSTAPGDGVAEPQPSAARNTRIFTAQLFRVRDGRGWAFTDEPPVSPPPAVRRPARVAQALALAHRIEAAIERGDYRDRADVARQLGFTRARVTQILDLTLLAPDIQEEIAFLEAVDGVEPLSARALRDILRHESWVEQRRVWPSIRRRCPGPEAPPKKGQVLV